MVWCLITNCTARAGSLGVVDLRIHVAVVARPIMGVLTDLVVADESEAEAMAGSGSPLERWPGIDAKGIDHVKLGMLLSIMAGEPYRDSLVGEFAQLAEASEDGPWVFQVPPRLVSSLSKIEDHELGRLSEQWSAVEEFAYSGYDLATVAEVMTSLRELSKLALSEGKSLLMWMCL